MRFVTFVVRETLWVGTAAGLGLILALGCASGGGGSEAPAAQEGSASASNAEPPPPKGVRPPADHKMAAVDLNMPPGQVLQIMGEPTSRQTYMTGKSWIPYYFGSDTHRTDWKYAGQGRVVFGTNRWSGNQKVIRIDYDPGEDGY